MEKLKTIQELSRMQAQAGELVSTLENCESTVEIIETLNELGFVQFTWQADTCYIDNKKYPLEGACKIFEYWQCETELYIKQVNYNIGVVIVKAKDEELTSVVAPLSSRVRELISKY